MKDLLQRWRPRGHPWPQGQFLKSYGSKRDGRPMAHADFRGTPTYFAVYKIILSKNVNQNMLKITYFSEKICQALDVPPPDPSWPPTTEGSAPRPLLPCNLTHTYSLLGLVYFALLLLVMTSHALS